MRTCFAWMLGLLESDSLESLRVLHPAHRRPTKHSLRNSLRRLIWIPTRAYGLVLSRNHFTLPKQSGSES
jgi:hypothetical protein